MNSFGTLLRYVRRAKRFNAGAGCGEVKYRNAGT